MARTLPAYVFSIWSEAKVPGLALGDLTHGAHRPVGLAGESALGDGEVQPAQHAGAMYSSPDGLQ